MHLAVHDHRIDRAPDIVDRGVAHDLHHAGLGIDLDLADMAAIGERREVHGLVADAVQAAQVVRQIVALHRRGRDLEDADRAVGALHDEAAGGEFQIGRGGFQHMAGDPHPLVDDLVRRVQHDDAAEPQRAAGMRAAADRDAVGVAVHQPTLSSGTPSHSLTSWAKLVSWPWPLDTVPMTTSTDAFRLHGDLGAFARHAGRGIDIVGDADAATSAAPLRLARGVPQSRPSRRAPARAPSPRDRCRCRRPCRTDCGTASRLPAPGCAGAVRCGRSRTAAPPGRSAVPSRTSPRAGRSCDRAASARCWSASRRRGNAPPARGRCWS